MVIVQLALQGTHDGPLQVADGVIEPTGNQIDAPCCDVFQLSDGYGSWGSSPYTAGPGTIMGARLLSANGTVLATATF